MRKLSIAYGSSRTAKEWSNNTITFDELCLKLTSTIRTNETVKEYPNLEKQKRDNLKDIGGFVGGLLRNNRRRSENVVGRSMLTLDSDSATKAFFDSFIATCRYTACLYTTHGHTPEFPRLRIVVPLTRDISADEYIAISRYFANEWGMEYFDDCSYRAHQLMYWPTTPIDGEYIFKRLDGKWLDPDQYLAQFPNWKDYSSLPTSSKEIKGYNTTSSKQQDPLTKEGIVGAFCRTYTIGKVIEKYLSNIYNPSAIEGRFDYIPADSSAGVVVYDERFAYSHHATDPAHGQLLNAFDIVRIHLFGDENAKASFNAMSKLASEDDEVKLLMTTERLAAAEVEFSNGDWIKELRYMPRSNVLENSVWNLMLILKNDPDFSGFAFNELAKRIQITGKVPWRRPEGNQFWRDADTSQLKALIDVRYLPFSTRNHDVAFTKVADDRHFHPIRDYLDSLPKWDGVKRVDYIFIKYLEADDSVYVRAVTRKTFAAAVARIYEPGIKFDSIPVLDGAQGIGKSSIVKDLVSPEYYSETLSLTDMDDKSGAEKLQGYWVIEIGELAGMRKADIEKVKAFISTSDDKFRPSYGRTVESHPRQCIIIATVNGERGYLRDITGNRRFWIIKLNQKDQEIKWNFTDEFREQFWAEAKELYEAGEKLYLDGEDLKDAERVQRRAMEVDERVGMIEEYLNTLLPENWDELDLYQRRSFLSQDDELISRKGTVKRATVSNAEIWCECFGRNFADLKQQDSYAIAAIMLQIDGWIRSSSSKRIPIYGRQRYYERT